MLFLIPIFFLSFSLEAKNIYEFSNENLEKDCNTFTEDNCTAAGCCVWAKTDADNKCVAGNKNGPIYKTDDNGNKIDIEAYYYKNKCYGNCK